ncbi:MAG: flagellar biosynthetic protein FliO [Oligoflexia bacterium]|nr:flagellar biosynthetic protein FliO [Oligoflexia bacterium]
MIASHDLFYSEDLKRLGKISIQISLVGLLFFIIAFDSVASIASMLSEANTSRVKIVDVGILEKDASSLVMVVDLGGKLTSVPELKIDNFIVQLTFPGSYVWPKIEKSVPLKELTPAVGGEGAVTVMAYQFEKDVVRVRAMLPFKIASEDDVQVYANENSQRIEVVIKLLSVAGTEGKSSANTANIASNNEEKVIKMLDELKVQEETLAVPGNNSEVVLDKSDAAKKEMPVKSVFPLENKNQVNTVAATRTTVANADHSSNSKLKSEKLPGYSQYVMKFTAFTFLVLALFYGMVLAFKKGMMGRNKLGFLQNAPVVSVLSNNYIAPKRSLVTVKVHNQIFLLGNSEQGIHMLAEIKDVPGMLREGERSVSGKNFDTSLVDASALEDLEQKVKLKESVDASIGAKATSMNALIGAINQQQQVFDMAASRGGDEAESNKRELVDVTKKTLDKVKDVVRFSDQIKKKVKGLRPLQ